MPVFMHAPKNVVRHFSAEQKVMVEELYKNASYMLEEKRLYSVLPRVKSLRTHHLL